jgi:2-methylcitrate dehydratase PrpD
LTVAKQCILDWFGVTLAGQDEPVARLLRDEIATNVRGQSSIVGSTFKCAVADAALINGATSHALDYDDVHPLIGHPTAAILPAALAVGEAEGRTGMEILRAFIAGYDAAAYVGSLVMPSHYDRGFHATATLGSFGAAAAAGVLMNLDDAQMAIALGLAGTQAAGLKSMFGSMAKPFHAGKAAANGVLAARLAARGFTAHPGVLEVAQGFIATQSDGLARGDAQLPRPGSMIVETLFKYHAACYLTHSTIEAISALRRQSSLSGSDVAAIDVHVPSGHLAVCNISAPRTGLETKFSLRHTAALAACGEETAAIQTYSDQNAVASVLTAVRDCVTIHGDRPPGMDAHVVITSAQRFLSTPPSTIVSPTNVTSTAPPTASVAKQYPTVHGKPRRAPHRCAVTSSRRRGHLRPDGFNLSTLSFARPVAGDQGRPQSPRLLPRGMLRAATLRCRRR